MVVSVSVFNIQGGPGEKGDEGPSCSKGDVVSARNQLQANISYHFCLALHLKTPVCMYHHWSQQFISCVFIQICVFIIVLFLFTVFALIVMKFLDINATKGLTRIQMGTTPIFIRSHIFLRLR